MTALLPTPAIGLDCEPEDAYEEFWHTMEGDAGVPDFDDDERDGNYDSGDAYFEFVSSIEA